MMMMMMMMMMKRARDPAILVNDCPHRQDRPVSIAPQLLSVRSIVSASTPVNDCRHRAHDTGRHPSMQCLAASSYMFQFIIGTVSLQSAGMAAHDVISVTYLPAGSASTSPRPRRNLQQSLNVTTASSALIHNSIQFYNTHSCTRFRTSGLEQRATHR